MQLGVCPLLEVPPKNDPLKATMSKVSSGVAALSYMSMIELLESAQVLVPTPCCVFLASSGGKW